MNLKIKLNTTVKFMRKESCRVCGLEMEPKEQCSICRNYVSLHCPKCGKTTDTQIHIHNQ